MNKNIVYGGILIAIVLAISALIYNPIAPAPASTPEAGAVGGETNYNTLGVSGLKVGSSCNNEFGSTAAAGCKSTTHLIVNTCNLLGMDATQNSSTTKNYDCAITGVTSADAVIAQLGTTTESTVAGLGGNWYITAAKASTTAGYVTVEVFNGSGVNAVPSASQVGSSTRVIVFQ